MQDEGRKTEDEGERRRTEDGGCAWLSSCVLRPSSAVELLRAAGHGAQAEKVVAQRSDDPRWQDSYDEWLRERATERGDTGLALALSEKNFWRQPSLARYNQLKTQAEAHGSWQALRSEVWSRLERDKQYALLTEALLGEGAVEEAIRTLRLLQSTPLGTRGAAYAWQSHDQEPLGMRVARAAEASHPREALALYEPFAEKLISYQGRDNYRAAAHYLSRVREIYHKLGELPAWHRLIGSIRERHKRLRALKEELDRAGL